MDSYLEQHIELNPIYSILNRAPATPTRLNTSQSTDEHISICIHIRKAFINKNITLLVQSNNNSAIALDKHE